MYIAKKPPNPIAPTSSAIHTCSEAKAASSERMVERGLPGCHGTSRRMAMAVAAKSAATSR